MTGEAGGAVITMAKFALVVRWQLPPDDRLGEKRPVRFGHSVLQTDDQLMIGIRPKPDGPPSGNTVRADGWSTETSYAGSADERRAFT